MSLEMSYSMHDINERSVQLAASFGVMLFALDIYLRLFAVVCYTAPLSLGYMNTHTFISFLLPLICHHTYYIQVRSRANVCQ